jgi:hypothetical protein
MYSSTLSLTWALDEGGWLTPRQGRFTPGNEEEPVVKKAGWAPGPFWTGAENLAPTGILSSDYPARNDLLYQLYHLFTWQDKTEAELLRLDIGSNMSMPWAGVATR